MWETRHAKDLRVEALNAGDGDFPAGIGSSPEILKDIMENTRLLLKARDLVYPVRGCAVMSLLKRAKINGTALGKVEKPILARILNHCLKVANGDALLRIADGKISAVHAGDRNDYAILEIPELFRRTAEYLEKEFPSRVFAVGSFGHSMVTAVWELSGEDALTEAYQNALALHKVEYEEIKPAVRLTSSDAAFSGANLYPTLFTGSRGSSVILGNPLTEELYALTDCTECGGERTWHTATENYGEPDMPLKDGIIIEILHDGKVIRRERISRTDDYTAVGLPVSDDCNTEE